MYVAETEVQGRHDLLIIFLDYLLCGIPVAQSNFVGADGSGKGSSREELLT